jgi:hypothetical protein
LVGEGVKLGGGVFVDVFAGGRGVEVRVGVAVGRVGVGVFSLTLKTWAISDPIGCPSECSKCKTMV